MKTPIRILVVDDDADVLCSTCRTLAKAGYVAGSASTGAEVLPALLEQRAQMVLLDRQLPDADGLEVCRQIKADPALAKVFVVITSGVYRGSDDRVAGLEAQADGYIEKPIGSRELLARVEAFVRIVRLTESMAEKTEALRASEQEFRSLAEAMPQIVWACRPDGENIYFNQQWVDYTGLTLEESYGHGWNKPFHPDDQQRAWEAWQNAINHNASYSLECRLRRTDGTYHWWLIRGVPHRDADGKILKWFGTCTDIEEIKLKEQALRESEDRYRTLFDRANEGICLLSANGDLVSVNESYARMHGYRVEEMLPRNLQTLNTPETTALVPAQLRRLLDGESLTFEVEHHHKDGHAFPLQVSASLISVGGENLLQCFHHDITERQRAEESLRLDNQIMASMADGVYLVRERDGVIVYANERFEQMFGYAHGELIGQHVSVVNSPTTNSPEATAKAIMAQLGRSGTWQGEVHNVRKDGTTFWCEARVTTFVHGRYGPVWVALHQDITERKQAEAALHDANWRMASIIEGTHVGTWEWNIQTGETVFNQVWAEIIGYTLEELAPISIKTWEAHVHPEDGTRSAQLLERHFAGELAYYDCECRMKHKDGHWIWVRDCGRVITRTSDGRPLMMFGTHADITERKQAEEKLRMTQFSVENAADALFWMTEDARIVDVNTAACRALGYTREELLQLRVPDVDAHYSAEVWPQHFAELQQRGSLTFESEHRAKDGRLIPVEIVATYLAQGSERYNCAFVRDITERRRIEAALQERFKELTCLYSISALIALPGLSLDEVLDKITQLIPPGWQFPEVATARIEMGGQAFQTPRFQETLWRMAREIVVHGRRVGQVEVCYLEERPTSQEGPFLAEERALLNAIAERIGRFIERTRAEAALRESHQRLEFALRGGRLGFWDWNPQTGAVVYGELWAEMLEYSPEEVVPSVEFFKQHIHPEDRAAVLDRLTGHIEGWLPLYESEHRLRTKSGRWFWVLDRGQIVERDANGQPVRVSGMISDITTRKQSEAALRASEARFRAVTDSATDAIISADSAGNIVGWNRGAERIFGNTEAEVRGQSLTLLLPFRYQEWHLAGMARMQARGEQHVIGKTVEVAGCHKDGHEFPLELSLGEWEVAEGRFYTAIVRDISARKQAEEKLRELSIAVEQSPVSIVITDPAGKIEYVNPKFLAVTGYTAEEVLGQNPRVLKSGETSPEAYRDLWQTITDGYEWRGEFHNRKKNGELFWESASISPIRDIAGHITRFVAVKEDITARKLAEAEHSQMEVQLRQAQKLESIGQLAAGIAHEINTPTQYIGDNTRFLQDAFKDLSRALEHYDRLLQAARQQQVTPELVAATAAAAEAADIAYLTEEVPKSIEQTLQGVARVAKIVRAMKDFSHPGSEAKVPTDINRAIESTVTVAHNEWKYVADLDLALDPQLPLVPCLPGEINQVILNLLINAAHAIGDVVGDGGSGKGRIHVSTSRKGDWAEIRVQDTGTGIPDAVRGRIFDPFFTTKAVGKGTGQGLTIAHSVVVKQHGGTIEFETELGKGTTFIVRLPLQTVPLKPEMSL